jgi:biopolymer transport protein TolR
MAFSTTGNYGTGNSGGGRLSSEMNLTPLIDILLVMLIIFMVIVPVMPRGLNSSLPSKTAAGMLDEAVNVPILIEAEQGIGVEQGETDVRYRVNGLGVERAEIGSRLQALLSRRSVRQVLLRADAKLDFGVIAGVIDAGQAAGAESIGLLTPGTLPR